MAVSSWQSVSWQLKTEVENTFFSSLGDKMEVEVNTDGILEDSGFEIMDDMDTTSFENERCGICMDVVIDRGLLDCCQHWFCFACIDNWATITSLCPLCQKEFQLITCVPVYDTIGSGKVDDDLLSGDDEWCIQGKNNTLSFPSYYIDENAVICLDGDGCKIRSGLVTTEEDPNLDTSIACDSCDLWYHAFCVGFDTEGTSESSWLCPRCVIDEVPQKLEGASETANHECSVEAALSRKVSVSVADAGETAVVVSMVERKQWSEVPNEKVVSAIAVNEDGKTENFLSYTSAYSPVRESESWFNVQPDIDPLETSLELSLSRDAPDISLKEKYVADAICEADGSNGHKISSGPLSEKTFIGSEPSGSESKIDLHLGLSLQSSLSVDKHSNAIESHVAVDVTEHKPSEESSLPVDKVEPDANVDAVGFSCLKRKATSPSDQIDAKEDSERENRETSVNKDTEVTAKKARRSDRESKKTTTKCGVRNSIKEGTQKHSGLPAASEDDQVRDIADKEAATSDIMSIVRGTYRRASNEVPCSKPMDKSSKGRDNGAGLRVKKIMRRAVEDESSTLVEGLRKQIREAVRNKDTKDFSKNMFDPKLLAAFRVAIGGSRTEPEPEPIKRLNPSIARVKKSMLQKGKTRESLTKKIYGTANGRRRRAWDREWEVEFWKHRCTKMSKPEKVETLKSVLDLLRKSSESSEMEHEPEGEASNSILSRLYLADTSVFPRRDDIKPLSALKDIGHHETALKETISKPTNENGVGQTPSQISKNASVVSGPSIDDKRKKINSPSLKVEAASRKVLPDGSKMKAQTMKEMPGKSDVKIDKKKWALEVLARKTAAIERDATQGKQEDNAVLKGNYPLIAQLPADMRPELAPSRHNKVPISARQAQLYRMTEHFLKKANLPVIRRTAETELAIADAVNIEKDIADRSNSKLVYVNLCSQMLRQHVNNSKPNGAEESNPSSSSLSPERTEPAPEKSSDPSMEEALRMAGLVSDSPSNSPYRVTDDHNDERFRDEEGPENVFDMDSHPDLDIYGDFEYDLEDEDFIGASALNVSKSQQEEVDLKMKVVFSTLNTAKIDNAPNSKDHERFVTDEAPVGHNDAECEIDGELSLAECEELYGPDKEPLMEKFPKIELTQPDKLVGATKIDCGEDVTHSHRSGKAAMKSEFQLESCAENIFVGDSCPAECGSSGGENSPNHSLMSGNVRRRDKETQNKKQTEISNSISKKVEAYIKEHIRPLCKSGVITAEQYRWAVSKTTEKVMRYHLKDKNANFLIKEGEKVKKLAEQYVEAAQQKKETQ
ncbi:zinc finger protein [Macleaya cordata]|uniref:Zinc finger protein n=1 Tax=Macleaya cordata TaxID=56857 RepID=A0A200PRU3_MACCD|nr:zinc finger protein [Macleaya cordata]